MRLSPRYVSRLNAVYDLRVLMPLRWLQSTGSENFGCRLRRSRMEPGLVLSTTVMTDQIPPAPESNGKTLRCPSLA